MLYYCPAESTELVVVFDFRCKTGPYLIVIALEELLQHGLPLLQLRHEGLQQHLTPALAPDVRRRCREQRAVLCSHPPRWRQAQPCTTPPTDPFTPLAFSRGLYRYSWPVGQNLNDTFFIFDVTTQPAFGRISYVSRASGAGGERCIGCRETLANAGQEGM